MSDGIPSPYTEPPPPRYSSMAMLYIGLVIIGTAALLLTMYNIIIIRWCAIRRRENAGRREGGSQSFELSNSRLLSSFKFNKENMVGIENGGEFECAVCLSVFEEGEEVRQLPGCKHYFHASCIDMWLYSHSDCPLCRTRVQPPLKSFCRRVPAAAAENTAQDIVTREQFVTAAANVHFIPLV